MADARLLFPPGWKLTDSNNEPVSSGVIKFFDSGTSNPRTVYSDPSLSTSLGTEISTNSSGRPASGGSEVLVYASEGNLTLQALTSASGSIWSYDNVLGALDTGPFSAEVATPDRPVLTKTGSYTAVDADRGSLVNLNANDNPTILTLPSAADVGDGWVLGVKNVHSSATDVYIQTVGGQTIDGSTTLKLNERYMSADLVSDAAGWHVLSDKDPENNTFDGFLYGLTISINISDQANDIDIAAGKAADDTNTQIMHLQSSITKQIDSAWAVGSGNGGLDTGSVANVDYHVFLIRRSDTGVVDALFSTSATNPTMPTNYDQKRRIGSIIRLSGVNRPFVQNGDNFIIDRLTPIFAGPRAAWGLIDCGAPKGINVQPILSGSISETTASAGALQYVGDWRDAAQETAIFLSAAPRSATPPSQGIGTVAGGFFTSTDADIHYFATGAAALFNLYLNGWIDDRGRSG